MIVGKTQSKQIQKGSILSTNRRVFNPISVCSVFIWIGFISAISFMEAWIKFQAPGITIAQGLSVGKLVFGALNIVEWGLMIIILSDLLIQGSLQYRSNQILVSTLLFITVCQTFWLLPALTERANLIIAGSSVGSSSLHTYYIGFEIIKIVTLFILGIKLLRR